MLYLLPQVFPVVYAPPAVQSELRRSLEWLIIKPVQNMALVAALEMQLDAGEAEVIALAMELENAVVILDDKKARRIAKELGLRVIGTVGMLLRAKGKGIIDEVEAVLDALEGADFRLSEALRREALRLAGEDHPTS
jgi:predicted nucleic acid-binding protein